MFEYIYVRNSIKYFILACQTAVHKKCHDKLLTQCPGTGRDTESTVVSQKNYDYEPNRFMIRCIINDTF